MVRALQDSHSGTAALVLPPLPRTPCSGPRHHPPYTITTFSPSTFPAAGEARSRAQRRGQAGKGQHRRAAAAGRAVWRQTAAHRARPARQVRLQDFRAAHLDVLPRHGRLIQSINLEPPPSPARHTGRWSALSSACWTMTKHRSIPPTSESLAPNVTVPPPGFRAESCRCRWPFALRHAAQRRGRADRSRRPPGCISGVAGAHAPLISKRANC